MKKMMQCYQTDDGKYIIMEFAMSGASVCLELKNKKKIVMEGITKECLTI